MQASAAAARAMALLAPARGTRVRTKTYPPQRDITDEPPRVGVFICHCGSNIASVVDVERVVKRTRELPHVVLAENNIYTCADDTPEPHQGADRRAPAEPRGRRLLHAADARADLPRHAARRRPESLPARDGQHPRPVLLGPLRTSPEQATDKAVDLVRMAVGRARRGCMPLAEETRAGEQRRAGRRRRHRRHDRRPGPGRPGLPRPPGREDRRARRHRPPAPPHARRPGRAGVPRRDDRPRARPHADHRAISNAHVAKVEGHVGDFTSTLATETRTRRASSTAWSSWPPAPRSRSRKRTATAKAPGC